MVGDLQFTKSVNLTGLEYSTVKETEKSECIKLTIEKVTNAVTVMGNHGLSCGRCIPAYRFGDWLVVIDRFESLRI